MALRDPYHDHDPDHRPAVVEHESTAWREPFGISQVVSLAIGIFLVVLGAIGLARTGLDSMTEPVANVGGLSMTPLLALLHVVAGLIALAGASGRAAARTALLGVGIVLVIAGIVALVENVEALGWSRANGVAYLIIGGVAMAAAILTPSLSVYERRRTAV